MLGWAVFAGSVLVFGILADDWYANRSRRPLSHMKPDPNMMKGYTGIEELDITNANRKIARNEEK